MKLRYSTVLIFAALISAWVPFGAKAQDGFVCGHKEAYDELVKQHPELLEEELSLEQFTKNYIARYNAGHASRASRIIIPVVFHIIHQGGAENISDAQVYDQMRILNRDYNLLNNDISNVTDSSLQDVIANVGFEFRLAKIDPQGNCTNGIDRVYSIQTFSGNDYSKLNGWPREKYLNIWVVARMRGGAAGYAYYPNGVQAVYNFPNQDGVIILHDYVGSIGTSSSVRSRAVTHEIGHSLNLKHPWGDSNSPGIACGDDNVHDTPETKGFTSCPNNNGAKVCNPPIVENYQNYMDYSYCSVMFTNGQKLRMLAALDTNIAGRNNLYQPANLVATGVADTPGTPCAPKADFFANNRYICVNGTVKLTSSILNAAPDSTTTYEWSFPSGNPETSTEANPSVQFLLPGWQPITLKVTNQYGSSTKSNNLMVYAGYELSQQIAPFYEGFEDPEVFTREGGWAVMNTDNNNTFFRRTEVPHNGWNSAYLNNYFARNDRDQDELISPAIDLSFLERSEMNLSFYYSWASANFLYNYYPDSIAVMATNDCGKTWIPLFKKNGNAVLGYHEGPWSPSRESGVWKKEEISLGGSLYDRLHKPNIRFKFQVYSSVGGNNFYIDDINIGLAETPVTGIEEQMGVISNLTLFPNPTTGTATVDLRLAETSKVSIRVMDITGKLVKTEFEGQLTDGETRIQINSDQTLSKGMYILNVTAGENTLQKKLVIQ